MNKTTEIKISDSVSAQFQVLANAGAAMSRLVFRDDKDVPIGAAVFVLGPIETDEVLAAVLKLEEAWTSPAPAARTPAGSEDKPPMQTPVPTPAPEVTKHD